MGYSACDGLVQHLAAQLAPVLLGCTTTQPHVRLVTERTDRGEGSLFLAPLQNSPRLRRTQFEHGTTALLS